MPERSGVIVAALRESDEQATRSAAIDSFIFKSPLSPELIAKRTFDPQANVA
jgi:hypothetical protein